MQSCSLLIVFTQRVFVIVTRKNCSILIFTLLLNLVILLKNHITRVFELRVQLITEQMYTRASVCTNTSRAFVCRKRSVYISHSNYLRTYNSLHWLVERVCAKAGRNWPRSMDVSVISLFLLRVNYIYAVCIRPISMSGSVHERTCFRQTFLV